ncbi:MAG: ornithine carbamoyltransferase [Alphaproteobacteria bacterium]|nr:ornithine carbamoyltransferase [Alphaproteobacteria bacterium]
MSARHFLDIHELESAELRQILDVAGELKGERKTPRLPQKTLAMIFDKPSTRTRVSFEVAIKALGGDAVVLNAKDMQLGRGETIEDTARVLSRYVDAIMIRTDSHEKLLHMAEAADVPVINGLTDFSHPCQIMADIMTFEEHRGPIRGRTLAWAGDGNNVASSWIHAAQRFDFSLNIACPDELRPDPSVVDWARERQARVKIVDDPVEAVTGADAVMTDVWVSMGDAEADRRRRLLAPYQVNSELMAAATDESLFLHCLPAHRDEEVTASVIDGPQSVVFDQAENRLHAQKGILAWCLG